jgi:hypothetical protein
MVWYLLLAHFLADYLLQPDWMVRAKTRLRVLALHVATHFLVTLAIVGSSRGILLPYILVLALVHFEIDLVKNMVYRHKPNWVIIPYLTDQVIHYLSIVAVTLWIRNQAGEIFLPADPQGLIYMLGLVLVTYVWFISERIFAYKDEEYRRELVDQIWSRMFVRAGIVSFLLMGWNLGSQVLAFGITVSLPYGKGRYGRRALVTDIVVSFVVVVLIQLAIG